MSVNLRFTAVARAAVLSAALALPAATAAHADGDFNISRESAIVQSAASAPAAPLTARLASTVPTVAGKRALIGAGGHQDELANKIYQPGHTVGVGG